MIPVCAKPADVEKMLHIKENCLVLLWTPSWEKQAHDEQEYFDKENREEFEVPKGVEEVMAKEVKKN